MNSAERAWTVTAHECGRIRASEGTTKWLTIHGDLLDCDCHCEPGDRSFPRQARLLRMPPWHYIPLHEWHLLRCWMLIRALWSRRVATLQYISLGGWHLRRWMLIRAFVAPAYGAALHYISHGALSSRVQTWTRAIPTSRRRSSRSRRKRHQRRSRKRVVPLDGVDGALVPRPGRGIDPGGPLTSHTLRHVTEIPPRARQAHRGAGVPDYKKNFEEAGLSCQG